MTSSSPRGAAGILGAFPTQNCRTSEQLDEWLTTIVTGVRGRPWAVDLITHRSNARLADDLRLVAEYRPPVVITALGSPLPGVEVVASYGGLVIAGVSNLSLARKAILGRRTEPPGPSCGRAGVCGRGCARRAVPSRDEPTRGYRQVSD